MKKMLLIIKEDIVVYARNFDSIWMDRMSPVFPYRSNDSKGNPYARALRIRDHNVLRGVNVEVLILPEGDVRDYYYKKYISSTKEFILNDNSEEIRQEKINMIEAFFGLEQEDFQMIEYMQPKPEEYSDCLPKEYIENMMMKSWLHEEITEEESKSLEKFMELMDSDKAIRAAYGMAAHCTRVCLDPAVGKTPEDRSQEHIQKSKNMAICWWEKLMGTQHEKKSLSEIARIHSWSCCEPEAIDIYKNMLKRSDLEPGEKESIERKISTIGYGREIYREARDLYDKRNYDGCISKIVQCREVSTGATRTFLRQALDDLEALVITAKARNSKSHADRKSASEAALKLRYPEKFYSKNKTLEMEATRLAEAHSRLNEIYFSKNITAEEASRIRKLVEVGKENINEK